MDTTLTVEPGFKSSHDVAIDDDAASEPTTDPHSIEPHTTDRHTIGPAPLLTIGEAADLVGVATSTLRYYERRGLVVADARVSGQRRYRWSTVRRMVFVQMLQDAGLSLDDIQGVLEADDNAAWKEIAHLRLALLDDEITTLRRARDILSGALLCRYDHPLDECQVMNGEIDRRLADPGDAGPGHLGPMSPSGATSWAGRLPEDETEPAPIAR